MENNVKIYSRQRIDIMPLVMKILYYKYLFVTTIVLSLLMAFLFNSFKQPVLKNHSKVFLSADDNNIFEHDKGSYVQQMGLEKEEIDNQIEILTSNSLIRNVVEQLNLEIEYLDEKIIFNNTWLKGTSFTKKNELYNQSPIKVVLNKSRNQIINTPIYISFTNDGTYSISFKAKKAVLYNYLDNEVVKLTDKVSYNNDFSFGDEIDIEYCSFLVKKTEHFNNYFKEKRGKKKKHFLIVFRPTDLVTQNLKESITVEATSMTSSVIDISVEGNNLEKITDFINSLTSFYFNNLLEKKNNIAKKTEDYIEQQISGVQDTLSTFQNRLRDFRSVNSVTDLNYQGQQILSEINELEKEIIVLRRQKRYYDYIDEYLKTDSTLSDFAIPSSVEFSDEVLNKLISVLIELNSEKSRMSGQSKENLFSNKYDKQIEDVRNSIQENIQNNKKTLSMSLQEAQYRLSRLTSKISSLPKTELELQDIKRQFDLSDELYTFLLQKRAEAQIARSSNFLKSEILDPAREYFPAKPIAPNKGRNYSLAFVLGLFIPLSYILIIESLNNKVKDSKDIQELDIPIVGKIFHGSHKSNQNLNIHNDKIIAESFRTLVTSLLFNNSNKNSVFLVTSCHSGEGKTFISINLALALAYAGKKTLFMELDFRKPGLKKQLHLLGEIGLTDFLNGKAEIEDIIYQYEESNAFFISTGTVPPNPYELISNGNVNKLLLELKDYYEYIIIDTAPVGIASETYYLMAASDLNLLVARQNVTLKGEFKDTIDEIKNNQISNIAFLLNDINMKISHSYKYQNSKKTYGYKYI